MQCDEYYNKQNAGVEHIGVVIYILERSKENFNIEDSEVDFEG